MYNPAQYWSKRLEPNSERTNKDEEEKNRHVQFIKKNILDCQRICVLGPGIGRLVESYDNKDVTFVDIHESYKDRLLGACKAFNISHSFTKVASLSNLPFENSAFDTAIFSLVLLHVPHKEIEGVLRESIRVAKRLVVIDVCPDYQTSASHVFTHDFQSLARKIGCNINIDTRHGTSMFFTISH